MILDRVRELIARQMCIDVEKVSADSRIVEDIGADSLDIVEMLMTVEEEWNLIVEDDDMRGFTTVASVAEYIENKIK